MESRRERNKQDKRDRILAAARELFVQHGVSSVTTQQISERADVAAGTLFRYASTKGELILMVENDAFEGALARGIEASDSLTDPAEAAFAIIESVLGLGLSHTENTAAYQRELMFGTVGEPHHTRGLQIVEALVNALSETLLRAGIDADEANIAARSMFAVMHLALVSASLPSPARPTDVRDQITRIARGATSTDAVRA